jgi:hypothetical protein
MAEHKQRPRTVKLSSVFYGEGGGLFFHSSVHLMLFEKLTRACFIQIALEASLLYAYM